MDKKQGLLIFINSLSVNRGHADVEATQWTAQGRHLQGVTALMKQYFLRWSCANE
jgi:hypothetical protein